MKKAQQQRRRFRLDLAAKLRAGSAREPRGPRHRDAVLGSPDQARGRADGVAAAPAGLVRARRAGVGVVLARAGRRAQHPLRSHQRSQRHHLQHRRPVRGRAHVPAAADRRLRGQHVDGEGAQQPRRRRPHLFDAELPDRRRGQERRRGHVRVAGRADVRGEPDQEPRAARAAHGRLRIADVVRGHARSLPSAQQRQQVDRAVVAADHRRARAAGRRRRRRHRQHAERGGVAQRQPPGRARIGEVARRGVALHGRHAGGPAPGRVHRGGRPPREPREVRCGRR